jgi:tetratricopeptide (TPR) repeat protein/tRNA A-37 threonylcarbamoyl transferase component Bud32/TolB-like protein
LAASSNVGAKLGHYRILEKLGEGGMGVVYRALDENLQREVALKVLRVDHHDDGTGRTRMRREALALAQLNHPNIATVYNFESDGDTDFVVLEYVSGESLAHLIRQKPLGMSRLLGLGAEIADAVEKAHSNGIIHCDLKPSNIVLTEDGHAKVLDFGLARLFAGFGESGTAITATGSSGGTLPYMSPEQLSGKADVRSDVYALGTVLFEMSTGIRAFQQEHFADLVDAILHSRPTLPSTLNPEIPHSLDAIIVKAMAKDPKDRYQAAAEVRDDLMRLSAGIPVTAKVPPSGISRAWQAISVLAVLAVISLVSVPFVRKVQTPSTAQATPARIVAVLPFESVGGAPEDEALCRGLTEALTANLAQQGRRFGWEVVPAAEVRKQDIKDSEGARRILGANLVIEGSWQFKGANQVAYGLVDAKNRRHVDGSVVRADSGDYFGLENQVLSGSLRMLSGDSAPVQIEGPQKYRPKDPKAYQYYLRARGYLQNYQQPQNVDSAVALLKSAIELDSNFALAHASLAEAYWRKYLETKDANYVALGQKSVRLAQRLAGDTAEVLSTLGLLDQGTGNYEKAAAEYERVIAINPTDDTAYRGLATAYKSLGNNVEAERAYRRAIEIRKDSPYGYTDLAVYLFSIGRTKEAEPVFQRAIELAPENPKAYTNLGGLYYVMADYPKAIALFEKSNAVMPNFRAYLNLGTVYYFQGHFGEAARSFEKSIELDNRDYRTWHNLGSAAYWVPGMRAKSMAAYKRAAEMMEAQLKVNPRDAELLTTLADCKSMLGQVKESESYMAAALKLAPDSALNMLVAAELYEHNGKRDLALHWVSEAVKHGYAASNMEHSEGLRELRKDPRFKKAISPQ